MADGPRRWQARAHCALLLLLLAGCAVPPPTPSATLWQAGDALRDAVADAVHDPGRRARALVLVERLRDELEQIGRENEARDGESARLFADYRATRKDVELFLAAAQASRERARARLIDLRLRLADLLSADEWQAVAAADADVVADWLASDG